MLPRKSPRFLGPWQTLFLSTVNICYSFLATQPLNCSSISEAMPLLIYLGGKQMLLPGASGTVFWLPLELEWGQPQGSADHGTMLGWLRSRSVSWAPILVLVGAVAVWTPGQSHCQCGTRSRIFSGPDLLWFGRFTLATWPLVLAHWGSWKFREWLNILKYFFLLKLARLDFCSL